MYTVVTTDVSQFLTCTITATNSGGSGVATSASVTGVAAPVTPSPTPSPAGTGPQIVQKTVAVYTSSATRPITVTFPNPVTAGNLILVAMSTTQGRTYNVTLTDNKSNGTYTWYNDTISLNFAAGWQYKVATNGGSSFTISGTGGAGQDIIMNAYEISNFDPTIFDGAAAMAGTASTLASVTKTTTLSNSLVLGVYAGDFNQTITPNNPTDAVTYTNANTHSFGTQSLLVSTPSSTTLSWNIAQANGWLNWVETVIAIKSLSQ
jgi:hypothetical protein